MTRRCTECDLFGEPPPVDLETERAVVSMLLLSAGYWPEVTAKILEQLQGDDFQREAHRVLVASVKRAVEKRVGLKGRYLLNWLKRDGALKEVGRKTLSEILETWWLRGNLTWYLRRLREVSRKRRAVEGTWELVPVAYEGDVQKWVERAKTVIAEVER